MTIAWKRIIDVKRESTVQNNSGKWSIGMWKKRKYMGINVKVYMDVKRSIDLEIKRSTRMRKEVQEEKEV